MVVAHVRQAQPPAIGVVIVSWKVPQLLDRCLSALEATGLPLRIVVVDNASGDETVALVRRRHPTVQLIANPDNRGFTAANNQGMRALGLCLGEEEAAAAPSAVPTRSGEVSESNGVERGQKAPRSNEAEGPDDAESSSDPAPASPPPYVFLLNPDTEPAPDALPRLVACLEARPRTAVAGPTLVYGDGRPQPSRRRFLSLPAAWLESTPIGWHWPGLPAIARFHMADRPEAGPERVDWLVGAALLCRREALEAAGGLDEGFFMYAEEMDLCRRLADLGWETWYCPGARVLHHEGQSSGQVSGLRHRLFQRARVRYVAKHHGVRAAAWLRRGLLAQYAAELLLEAAKGLLGHRRELRRARVAAYTELLKDGLR